jgi:hypothetical protein
MLGAHIERNLRTLLMRHGLTPLVRHGLAMLE